MTITIKTQDELNTSMLENISDDYAKETGFLTGDLVKTNSIELGKIYTVMQALVDKVDIDNLTGAELTKYVLQRKGIVRKTATYATVILTITGTGTINAGDLFATASNKQFESSETLEIIGSGSITATAILSGTGSNVGANTITSMPITLTGITAVNNAAAAIGGYAEETDAAVRERYYTAIQTPATSGNIYHYEEWALEVSGVGAAKVTPLWNGANTVKVTIINSSMLPASSTLISTVQEYIDPIGDTWGTGSGEAPIGAYCTVDTADSLSVAISVSVTKTPGALDDDIITSITSKVTAYLKEIAFDDNYTVVSYAKVGALILEVTGVEDYTSLTLNGGTTSLAIADTEVAVLSTVALV